MANTTIRLANENDAVALHQLMHEAFTPLRELGIDWPSVNANLDAVKENIDKNTTFVMTNVVFLSIFSFTASKFAFTEGQSMPSSLNGVNASCIN